MREVHKFLDDYTEEWAAEDERNELRWKNTVEAHLIISRLPKSLHDLMRKEAEGKRLWELFQRGIISDEEFTRQTKEVNK